MARSTFSPAGRSKGDCRESLHHIVKPNMMWAQLAAIITRCDRNQFF